MSSYREIGHRIQQAREEAGLSQEELAGMMGCTQASLSNYELGKRRLYLTDLQRMGGLLGKPITYFLEESDEEKKYLGNEYTVPDEPYVREIVNELLGIDPAKRESILNYVKWLKSEEGGK